MKKQSLLYISFFFALLATLATRAQEIYIVTEDNDIKILEVSTLTVTDLFTIDILEVGYIVDLAFTPDGTLYGITGNRIIIEIDLDLKTYEIIFDIPLTQNFPGLVANSDGALLFSSVSTLNLLSYTVANNALETITTNISTPGDFTFYKGNLLFPSDLNSSGIRSFDGTLISNVGCTEPLVFTLVNDFIDCDTNTIYGIDEENILYKYSIGVNEVETIGTIDVPQTIFGGATKNEYLASNCPLTTINTVNCAPLSIQDFSLQGLTIYPNPTSNEVFIKNNTSYQVRSITVKNLQGKILKKQLDTNTPISLSGFQNGTYFIEIETSNNIQVYKTIKN